MNLSDVIQRVSAIRGELSKVIVGQQAVLDQVLIALLAQGHALIEGPPGTGKTLIVRGLAAITQGQFRRIQFTPDMMPADIVGVNVFDTAASRFEFRPGPVFCDLLLADEINRAPSKTQSALLEAMQEGQVSVDGQTHPLRSVFTVFATLNPIEYEGTYPLPEAQLDRFMLKIVVDYPSREDEDRMLQRHQEGFNPSDLNTASISPQVTVEQLAAMRQAVLQVRVVPPVLRFITSIVRTTREYHALMLGASPRAAVMVLAASRAVAALRGRDYVTPDDVKDITCPVLRHRVVLNPESEVEGVTADQCIKRVLDKIEVPRL